MMNRLVDESLGLFRQVFTRKRKDLMSEEIGKVTFVGEGVARVDGLDTVRYQELLEFSGKLYGTAFAMEPGSVSVMLLDDYSRVRSGQEVKRTERIIEVPVGEELLGRTVDPLARPLDGGSHIDGSERRGIEREAPEIMGRDPVTVPLQTGIQSIDALIPIGRGQRELILGDRQTGKTAIAVDTILNQVNSDVLCVYCAIGKRKADAANVVDELREAGVLKKTIVVVATEEDTPGLNYIAPYSATAMAEYFMDAGNDVLVVYDDLTRHARSYRELSLLLRRPPAREAYPGDIFYIHSRLLERATHFDEENGGGSMTALPIIETQAQNISAYIPTNLISITDGQIYLSPDMFQKGIFPAVDVGKSVSRVGGKTQLPAYREVAGDLRLSYSQFEELESFSRFGVRLDEETRKTLERGRRVREVLKQNQSDPMTVPEQIAVLTAVISGIFDPLPVSEVGKAKRKIREKVRKSWDDMGEKILAGGELDDEDLEEIERRLGEMDLGTA
jgi:F-type H+-transporting ATPase subunit alpha